MRRKAVGVMGMARRKDITQLGSADSVPAKLSIVVGENLRRLRRKGLIQRIPRTNTYALTSDGIRVAVFYTKLQKRLLRPLLAADQPPVIPELRQALRVIDNHVLRSIDCARLPIAA